MNMQKGVVQIVLLFILLAGIFVGIILVQQQTNLSPKAAELITKPVIKNNLLAEQKKVAGIDANGKLVTSRAKDLANISPKSYQRLVQQGLIANPNLIKSRPVHIQGGSGGGPTPAPNPSITSPSINTCGDIASNGNYFLTADITSQNICINIHDTNNVNLDCQNHIITSSGDVLVVTNVQNFSIKNCTIRSTANFGIPFNILNSNSGNIQGNTFQGAYANVYNSNNLQISNNTFNAVYQQMSSSFNQIHDNQFKANITSGFSPAAVVISNDGNNNMIQNNVLDGQWDNAEHLAWRDYKGADDGIVIYWESQDEITGNTISNNWDCGIETSGLVQDTKITNNQINHSGICGIGGWYWNSWLHNTIDSNVIDGAAYMFYLFRTFGLDLAHNEQYVYFKDNNFTNNTFLHQRASSYVGPTQQYSSVISYQYFSPDVSPSMVQVGNNIFRNNDFDQSIPAPYLIPTAMIVDQGGNKCLPVSDSLQHPLVCSISTPAPTLIPSPSPLPSPTPIPKPSPKAYTGKCVQVITRACAQADPKSCYDFPTPCSIPDGWVKK